MRVRRMVHVVVAVMAVLALMLACAGQASANMPWWHINTISTPAAKSGEEDLVTVEVSNLGDALADGSSSPVTIVDKLPAGVTASAIYEEGGGAVNDALSQLYWEFGGMKCVLATLTCTYTGQLLAYERLLMVMYVHVAPGAGDGINEVSVSGGNASSLVSGRPLALEGGEPSFGVQTYELTPEEEGGGLDTQAGSHPFQLTTTLTLNTRSISRFRLLYPEPFPEVQPLAFTRDLQFELPPGLVGNPTPLPKCSAYTFSQEQHGVAKCPDDTVVGVATPIVTRLGQGGGELRTPLAPAVPLYSLEPAVGEPARFGFIVSKAPVILDTSVRTGGDYGVIVTVPNVTQLVGFIGSQVTFWGVPADSRHDMQRGTHCVGESGGGPVRAFVNQEPLPSCPVQEKPQPLLILPTSCTGPLHTTVRADSWEAIGQYISKEYTFQDGNGEPYGLDGCNRLNFEPSIKAAPDGQQAATPTGLTVEVHVPQDASLNPGGLAESSVKDTIVALPAGVGLNPAGADGLQSCSLAQVGLESPSEQTCPEAAKVGTVEIETPLLPHRLEGAAYLAQQDANPFGSLVALYIVAKDPVSGVIVKLAGEVKPDPLTGQLVSRFDNTPQLPFENLRLHFFGGSRAPLGTPALCGSYTTTASIAPWSGNAPVDSSSTFEITSAPNHTPCQSPLPFDPELTTGSLNIQAGAFTPFTMTMSRQDGNQSLNAIQLKMPPGLLGTLAGVKLCDVADADAGTCGPESLIGHTIVSVGLGGDPYTVTGGQVYITGPYRGAPYGLSIVNPAKAGPFDLGKVIVRAKIEVDPTTAALTITSDASGPYAIPQILDGIPLQIKHVNVTIDRPNFTFNPTNCEPQHITGSLTSSEGTISGLSVPFQVTNCAVLKFKPQFQVWTTGKTSRANGASLNVRLTYPSTPFGTGANIRYVKVDLPRQLPSRLETLKKACPDTVFDQDPAACPAASRVGTATATTPIIPVPLSGPAYFVSHGGVKFPELIIVLSGYGTTVYLHGETFISQQGITSSTFHTIPDVPVGTFELHLPQGPYSALAANTNLCTATLRMPTAFGAQNGMQIHQSTPITVTNCPKHKPRSKHAKHPKNKHNKKK